MEINNTIDGINLITTSSGKGLLISIISFSIIVLTIFFVSKNFRRFIYGALITVVLTVIIFISRYIGEEANIGNSKPFNYLSFIMIFILVSICIGWILQKKGYIEKMEKFILGAEENGL